MTKIHFRNMALVCSHVCRGTGEEPARRADGRDLLPVALRYYGQGTEQRAGPAPRAPSNMWDEYNKWQSARTGSYRGGRLRGGLIGIARNHRQETAAVRTSTSTSDLLQPGRKEQATKHICDPWNCSIPRSDGRNFRADSRARWPGRAGVIFFLSGKIKLRGGE